MTTTQLIIVCLTVLALAGIAMLARAREVKAALRRVELETSDRIRRAEWQPPAPASITPPVGASLAVHFDGRVVQGILEEVDASVIVLSGASVVTGEKSQPIGGRQYISRGRVVQIQELAPAPAKVPRLRAEVRV